MSKNQIWVVIVVLAIGVLALVTDIQIQVEIGEEKYSSEYECKAVEMQKCSIGGPCVVNARILCEEFLPKMYTVSFLNQRQQRIEEHHEKIKEACMRIEEKTKKDPAYLMTLTEAQAISKCDNIDLYTID